MDFRRIFLYLLFSYLNLTNCCECDKKSETLNTVKQDLGFEAVTTEANTSPLLIKLKTNRELQTTEKNEMIMETTEENTKVTNKTTVEYNEECAYLKNGRSINLTSLADIWQTAYYKTKEKIACFKIQIRRTTPEGIKFYARKYKDFNETINWDDCLFEIRSSDKYNNIDRKHFLQLINNEHGVFENVILLETGTGDENKSAVLLEQSPDQWLVFNNLLLMRDCDNGDVLVFSRVPYLPKLEDVVDALKVFGEEAINGTLACVEQDGVERSVRKILRQVLTRLSLL